MDQTINKQRPFTGQPHTHVGNRGKTEIKKIIYRDVFDAVVKAIALCAGDSKMRERADNETLLIKDLYDIPEENLRTIDPVAVAQSVCVEIEKRQGIYPNVTHLQPMDQKLKQLNLFDKEENEN